MGVAQAAGPVVVNSAIEEKDVGVPQAAGPIVVISAQGDTRDPSEAQTDRTIHW